MSVLPEEFRLSSSGRDLIVDAFAKSMLGLVLLFALFPIWMMLITSFKQRSELFQSGVALVPQSFGTAIPKNESLGLSIPEERIHLFDRASGTALKNSDAPIENGHLLAA